MALELTVGDIHMRLAAMGHDVSKVRRVDGAYEIVLRQGNQAAADTDMATVLADAAAYVPTLMDRVLEAARSRRLTVEQLALAAVTRARLDSEAPPSWAVGILRALDASVAAELGS